jgi:hypothetical protein
MRDWQCSITLSQLQGLGYSLLHPDDLELDVKADGLEFTLTYRKRAAMLEP